MNKYTQLLSDTVIFGIGNFTTKLIYFFLMPIYTLALTAEEFGLADLLNNSLFLLMPILTLSISDAVFRFALDKDVNHRELFNVGIRILFGSYILLLLITTIIYNFFPYSYWWLFLLLYIVESLKNLLAQFVRGLGMVRIFALNGILGAVSLLIFTYVFLLKLHDGINGYLLAFVLSNVVSILYLPQKVNIHVYLSLRLFDKKLLSTMILYSLPLVPNMLSWWLTNISSRYIIVGYCGLSIAGMFAAASKIPALINVVTSVFQQSWQYASVREYQRLENTDFYTKVFQYYSCGVFVLGSFIQFSLPFISRFILKGDFYNAWTYSSLLLYSAMLGCFSVYFGTFYMVVKDNKRGMFSTLIGAIINVLLCFLLVPLIAVTGALIANVVSYMVIVGMRIYDSRKYVDISIQWFLFVVSGGLVLLQSIVLTFSFDGNMWIAACIVLVLMFLHRSSFGNILKYLKKQKFYHNLIG